MATSKFISAASFSSVPRNENPGKNWLEAGSISTDSVSILRNQLKSEFGIIAVSRTDELSPEILSDLVFLLRSAQLGPILRHLKSFRYFYAYIGHDDRYDIAAFHYNERAISFGGKSVYAGTNIDSYKRMKILEALAHEIGHAFLLDQISSLELEEISKIYGGWGPVFAEKKVSTVFSEPFFQSHPNADIMKIGRAPELYKENNIISNYSLNGIHEWFAEAFSVVILKKIGENGFLGKGWESAVKPRSKKEYWSNYRNLSNTFHDWLYQRIYL